LRKINNNAAVAQSTATHIVSPSTNGRQEIAFTSEIDRRNDIGNAGASGNQTWFLVDTGIPDVPG